MSNVIPENELVDKLRNLIISFKNPVYIDEIIDNDDYDERIMEAVDEYSYDKTLSGFIAKHSDFFYFNKKERKINVTKQKPKLEKCYGYFVCKCNNKWESSHVWIISNTNKVYYKQDCKKCKNSCNPQKIEKLINSKSKDNLEETKRRPHLQYLCHKCRNNTLPCS